MQAIGRVSYSWYLWHWPVLLLGIAAGGSEPLCRAGLVVLSLLLAVASYRWVESPIRHQTWSVSGPRTTVCTAMTAMIVVVLLIAQWMNAAESWTLDPTQQRYSQARGDTPLIYVTGCDDWFHGASVRACTYGNASAEHVAVLFGDSVAAQWFPALAKLLKRPDWRLVVFTKSACPMVDESIFYPQIGRIYTECDTWRRNASTQIAALHPDIVVLGSAQTYAFSRTQWIEGTARLLHTISKATGHVYILRGSPVLSFNGLECVSAQHWLPWAHPFRNKCTAPALSQRDDDVYQWLQLGSKDFDNVSTLDMTAAICPGGICTAERGGVIVFRDSQHLTASFARSLSGDLGRRIDLSPPSNTPAAGVAPSL